MFVSNITTSYKNNALFFDISREELQWRPLPSAGCLNIECIELHLGRFRTCTVFISVLCLSVNHLSILSKSGATFEVSRPSFSGLICA